MFDEFLRLMASSQYVSNCLLVISIFRVSLWSSTARTRKGVPSSILFVEMIFKLEHAASLTQTLASCWRQMQTSVAHAVQQAACNLYTFANTTMFLL